MQIEPLFQGKGHRNRTAHREQPESLRAEAVKRTNPTLPTIPLLPIVCVACLLGRGLYATWASGRVAFRGPLLVMKGAPL